MEAFGGRGNQHSHVGEAHCSFHFRSETARASLCYVSHSPQLIQWLDNTKKVSKICHILHLHSECSGNDALEHYSCCGHAWSCAAQRLKLQVTPRGLFRFLGIQQESEDHPVKLAVHIYAVNILKNLEHGSPRPELIDMYTERIRYACTLQPSLPNILGLPFKNTERRGRG